MSVADPAQTVAELLKLPPIPSQGRDRLIGTAIKLFYYHGINAIGLDRVLAEAAVSKTTFYKHFDSKEDLVVAALKTRDEWEVKAWREAVRVLAGDDPREQLLRFIDVLDILFRTDEFEGCHFINAAAEFPNPNDPVHQAAARHKRASRDMFRDLAAQARAQDPDAFADGYTLLFEGALVLRQVHDRDDAAIVVRPHVIKLINECLPERPHLEYSS